MEINNNLQNNLVEAYRQSDGVAQQIALKVMKDSNQQVEDMIQKLILDKPVQVTPKYDTSTFEFIV
jgi:hypothetical protein